LIAIVTSDPPFVGVARVGLSEADSSRSFGFSVVVASASCIPSWGGAISAAVSIGSSGAAAGSGCVEAHAVASVAPRHKAILRAKELNSKHFMVITLCVYVCERVAGW
jgi:hypothetical protein